MNIIILCSDDALAGILCYPLLREYNRDIKEIIIQESVMIPGKTPLKMFLDVVKKSGLKFALYQAIEIIGLGLIADIRYYLRFNKNPNSILMKPSKLALKFKIPIRYVKKIGVEQELKKVKQLNPDIILCLRFSEIIKKNLLEIPSIGILNFHPALLPSYGGLCSIFQAVNHNEKYAGATIHWMDEGIDSGGIAMQTPILINRKVTLNSLSLSIYKKGSELLVDLFKDMYIKKTKIEIEKVYPISYFSWATKKEVKEFFKNSNKLISISDFWNALFKYGVD